MTAGFSPEEMVAAAKRVENDAQRLYPFTRIIRIDRDNLATYCPNLVKKYPEQLSEKFPAFGYAAWKTEAVFNALSGQFGPCDGVVWVDGGCEINPSWVTKKKFTRMLQKASQGGHLVFALQAPEEKFTKKAAFELFPESVGIQVNRQYQAAFFILHGKAGLKIARRIFEAILHDFSIVDPTALGLNESPNLELPKCEQSLLSLAIKSQNQICEIAAPPAGNRGIKSKIRAAFDPVWVSRNRSGRTIIPAWIRFVP